MRVKAAALALRPDVRDWAAHIHDWVVDLGEVDAEHVALAWAVPDYSGRHPAWADERELLREATGIVFLIKEFHDVVWLSRAAFDKFCSEVDELGRPRESLPVVFQGLAPGDDRMSLDEVRAEFPWPRAVYLQREGTIAEQPVLEVLRLCRVGRGG